MLTLYPGYLNLHEDLDSQPNSADSLSLIYVYDLADLYDHNTNNNKLVKISFYITELASYDSALV